MLNDKECSCGSGEDHYPIYDARGICCGMACTKCEEEKKSKFRPEIFEDCNYWADEPIDEDY